MKLPRLFICVVMLSQIATQAQAAPSPDESIKSRQATLKLLGKKFALLSDITKGKAPYVKEEITQLATDIEALSKKFPEYFGPETSKGASKAKPEIWESLSKWDAAVHDNQTETAKLVLVSRSGGLPDIAHQAQAVAQSCKACHDSYRSR